MIWCRRCGLWNRYPCERKDEEMTIRCRKCGYEAENPEEFHRGCCWACVMGPWDEELDQ